MMRAPILLLRPAGICGLAILAGCGDSNDANSNAGTGGTIDRPPKQQAIYLRGSREARLPGTKIRNSAILSMVDATLLRRRGEDTVHGKVTTAMRDIWGVEMLTANQRNFILEESSFSRESEIGGQAQRDRVESTLTGIEFNIVRADEASPWMLSLDQKLTPLQELEMRIISDLWKEESHTLYPEEPLEIGQSWKADPKAFGAIFSPRLKVKQGEVVCRLDEITVLRGERCGSISIDIDITGTFTTPGGTGMNVQIALTGTIMRSLYKFFDMRTELKGSIQMEMSFPDENSEISIDGVAEFLRRAEIEPPPPASTGG